MPRCRVVKPEVVRLPLSDGDWIEVKKQLTFGEARRALLQMLGSTRFDGTREPDLKTLGLAEIWAYLDGMAWSFRDEADKPIPVTFDALLSFDTDTVREITRAIDTHDTAATKERGERKNDQSGSPASAVTSTSASDSTGPTPN